MYTAGPNKKIAKLAQTVQRVKLARTMQVSTPTKNDLVHVRANTFH